MGTKGDIIMELQQERDLILASDFPGPAFYAGLPSDALGRRPEALGHGVA